MFTGLIEEMGTLRRVIPPPGSGLRIEAEAVLEGTRIGDSIAVNGVCLTVTSLDQRAFTVDVMPETLRRSNLGLLHSGDRVNLERAMRADGRLDGHLVQGHVDGQGKIVRKAREGNAIWVTIEAPPEVMRYLVPRAFIAVDGVSLTVARLEGSRFAISLVPHTQAHITLPAHPLGYTVNLEVDILAKYVERLLGHGEVSAGPEEGISRDYLERHGFA